MRHRILGWVFSLLYGPLASLHELFGPVAFGPSWHSRRLNLFDSVASPLRYLDLGCGEGQLLASRPAVSLSVGIDPSGAAVRRARRRGVVAVIGKAEALPFRDAVFDLVISTYPGPWILSDAIWPELGRVLKSGGECAVLLGGTYERGPMHRVRRSMARVAYGASEVRPADAVITRFGTTGLIGEFQSTPDEWGNVMIWRGRRDPLDGSV